MNELVALEGIRLSYGSKTILHGIDLRLPTKGCTLLLGPTGTGKSSLLKYLTAACQDCSGHVEYGTLKGTCTAARFPHGRIKVNVIAQKATRPVALVKDYLSATAAQPGFSGFLQDLGCADLIELLNTPCETLSAKDWMRVCIVRAAWPLPALLLVDEPTAALAPEDTGEIIRILNHLKRLASLVVITHHVGEARALATHAMLIGNQTQIESASGEDFFEAPQSPLTQYYLKNGTIPEAQLADTATEQAFQDDILATLRSLSKGLRPSPGASHALQPAAFRWVVANRLGGTSIPGLTNDPKIDLQGLQGMGVTTLLNLTEQPFDQELASEFGMTSAFFPVVDMTPPTLEQAVDICAFLDQQLAAGQCVAVHCKGGIGRTGTILALYLMWRSRGSWTSKDALAAARRIERTWIQSESQEQFLEEFDAFIRHNVTF